MPTVTTRDLHRTVFERILGHSQYFVSPRCRFIVNEYPLRFSTKLPRLFLKYWCVPNAESINGHSERSTVRTNNETENNNHFFFQLFHRTFTYFWFEEVIHKVFYFKLTSNTLFSVVIYLKCTWFSMTIYQMFRL